MVNDFQSKLNTVAGALHTIYAMSNLYQEVGYDDLIASADGLRLWEGHCTDLMTFIKEAPMPVGAAVIHLVSREGKISFTRIFPHADMDQYDETIVRYRAYLRHMIMVENKPNATVEEFQGHRRYPAEETEGKSA